MVMTRRVITTFVMSMMVMIVMTMMMMMMMMTTMTMLDDNEGRDHDDMLMTTFLVPLTVMVMTVTMKITRRRCC